MNEYYKNNSISNKQNKISDRISTPVNQYSMNKNFIKTFNHLPIYGKS